MIKLAAVLPAGSVHHHRQNHQPKLNLKPKLDCEAVKPYNKRTMEIEDVKDPPAGDATKPEVNIDKRSEKVCKADDSLNQKQTDVEAARSSPSEDKVEADKNPVDPEAGKDITTSTAILLDSNSAVTIETEVSTPVRTPSVLKRPTTLDLKCKSTPCGGPKCSGLNGSVAGSCRHHSSSKHHYRHNTYHHGQRGRSKKSASGSSWRGGSTSVREPKKTNIFVRLTSLRRDRNIITSLALKATASSSTNGGVVLDGSSSANNGAAVARSLEGGGGGGDVDTGGQSSSKSPLATSKESEAARTTTSAKALSDSHVHVGNNNSFPPTLLVNGTTHFNEPMSGCEDLDYDSESFVSTVKLSALIGLVLLLVVSAVGTAMLLSVVKIWGNHHDNDWDNHLAAAEYYESAFGVGGHNDRLMHPKDLSTYLFKYEITRRHHNTVIKPKPQKKLLASTTASASSTVRNTSPTEAATILQTLEARP